MKKRIGIIGFGEMGKRHGLEFYESSKGEITIAGVVEPDDVMYENGCKWNNRESIPRYGTVAELIEKEHPDGIVIASPNFTHLENLQQLKGLRCPVLLEKPLDTSLAKIAETVRFAKSYKGVIIVDHVMRYAPVIRKARELIEEGKLGKICSFQFSQRTGIGMFHSFRRTKHGGGGHMIEKATHDLDVMLFLTGAKPLSVSMISKQHVVGGGKPNDLTCNKCSEIMTCHYASMGKHWINPNIKDVDILNQLCVFAKEVDVPDNETCMIKLSKDIFGTYSQTFFCENMPGHSRIYEVIGTEGALVVTLAEAESYRGLVQYYPFVKKWEKASFEFEYSGKIHYFGGPFVVQHFYNLMCGIETEPFTSVQQAYTAELLGFAAMQSSTEQSRFIDLLDIAPEDLKGDIQGG